MIRSLLVAAGIFGAGLLPSPGCSSAGASVAEPLPWSTGAEGWRTDDAWYDGKAEKCLYEATDRIYGLDRSYVARAYTNKQQMDPRSTTKASGRAAAPVECFKHHWSERVPTENYDYDYSTASFVRTADLAPFKLTAATQEDCGASFKQIWRVDEELAWLSSVYFPDAGLDRDRVDADVVFQDALSIVLRDLPFAELAPGKRYDLRLVPSQRSTRSTAVEPVQAQLTFEGSETLDVPAGSIPTHRVVVRLEGRREPLSFWFAADGTAPWLHALVAYEDGQRSYRLRSLERTAYWER